MIRVATPYHCSISLSCFVYLPNPLTNRKIARIMLRQHSYDVTNSNDNNIIATDSKVVGDELDDSHLYTIDQHLEREEQLQRDDEEDISPLNDAPYEEEFQDDDYHHNSGDNIDDDCSDERVEEQCIESIISIETRASDRSHPSYVTITSDHDIDDLANYEHQLGAAMSQVSSYSDNRDDDGITNNSNKGYKRPRFELSFRSCSYLLASILPICNENIPMLLTLCDYLRLRQCDKRMRKLHVPWHSYIERDLCPSPHYTLADHYVWVIHQTINPSLTSQLCASKSYESYQGYYRDLFNYIKHEHQLLLRAYIVLLAHEHCQSAAEWDMSAPPHHNGASLTRLRSTFNLMFENIRSWNTNEVFIWYRQLGRYLCHGGVGYQRSRTIVLKKHVERLAHGNLGEGPRRYLFHRNDMMNTLEVLIGNGWITRDVISWLVSHELLQCTSMSYDYQTCYITVPAVQHSIGEMGGYAGNMTPDRYPNGSASGKLMMNTIWVRSPTGQPFRIRVPTTTTPKSNYLYDRILGDMLPIRLTNPQSSSSLIGQTNVSSLSSGSPISKITTPMGGSISIGSNQQKSNKWETQLDATFWSGRMCYYLTITEWLSLNTVGITVYTILVSICIQLPATSNSIIWLTAI
jgi:hypothetical protein